MRFWVLLFATVLAGSTGELQWIVDAYTVVFAGLLLTCGGLGDRYGRRRVFVAGLEYAAGVDATVVGKPSAACFAAALAALDAEPELTWMITDDLEQDVVGAQLFGMKTVLLRTGKFRPEALEHSSAVPDAVLSSIANVPEWVDRPH